MPAVVRDIVNAVITELSQVPGLATQIYAAGRVQQHVQDAFLLEFEDFWWPDYMVYVTAPLDGTTGRLATDLVGPLGSITEYRDIHTVWPYGSNRKLRELPQSMNPTALNNSSGGAWYLSPDYTVESRPIRVYPASAFGDVVVWGRQRPTIPFDLSDTLYLDFMLLLYDATWMYCVDDGTVPAQVNKFQVLAQNRRRMVKASFGQHPIDLDPRHPIGGDMTTTEHTDWFTLDKHPLQ